MASCIADVQVLVVSIRNSELADTPLDSRKVVEWQCGKCKGVWKESVVKRSGYKWCPECEKSKGRTAKVTHDVIKGMTPEKRTPKGKNTKVCNVCCDDKSDGLMCVCPKCNFEACKNCVRRYILESPGKAKCMECEYEMTVSYMCKTFTKKWYTSEYRTHLDNMAKEYCLSLIPRCMGFMELKNAYDNACALYQEIVQQPYEYKGSGDKSIDVSQFSNKLKEFNEVANDARLAYYQALRGKVEIKQEVFIQGCAVDGCTGLVGEDYICKVCNTEICRKCRCLLNVRSNAPDIHRCDPNTVATVKSMKGNTKPCPKCAAAIYKIDGCDQMWCVVCKVAFSWTTGRVETRGIHNPHYFAWLREQSLKDGGNGDIPRVQDVCENNEERNLAIRFADRIINVCNDTRMRDIMEIIHRYVAVTPEIERQENNEIEEISQLQYCISYITGERTKDEWLNIAAKRIRDIQRQLQNQQILDTFSMMLSDCIISFMDKTSNPISCSAKERYLSELLRQLESAREYINRVLVDENVDMDYNHLMIIGSDWKMVSYRSVRTKNVK